MGKGALSEGHQLTPAAEGLLEVGLTLSPTSMTKKTHVVELDGERATIYRKPNSDNFYLNYTPPSGDRVRRSLRTDDLDTARERVEAFLKERLRMKWGASEPIEPLRATLHQLATLYFEEEAPSLNPHAASKRARAIDRLGAVLGWGFEIRNFDRSALTRFERALLSGLRFKPEFSGSRVDHQGWAGGEPLAQKSVFNEASNVRAVWKWGLGKMVAGQYLVQDDPFARMKFVSKGPLNPKEAISPRRFDEMMRVVDDVDPTGRTRMIMTVARRTGRRIASITQLRVGDLLLSYQELERAVRRWRGHPEILDFWVHGAVRWTARNDKAGVEWMAPLPADLREALADYLEALPDILSEFGSQEERIGPETPLFPAEKDPTRPVPVSTMDGVFTRVVDAAGLEPLEGSKWHGFRHRFRSERHRFHDKLVGIVAGWVSYGGSDDAINATYLDDPEGAFEVASFVPRSRHNSSQPDPEAA